MTNMQHYMDDIHDLLDGLDGEIRKRLEEVGKWDSQISKFSEEICTLEEYVFDTSNPLEERTEKLCRLTKLRGKLRDLAERKVDLADQNQMTVQAVYSKLAEIAYHCKCEVEIDNPGCTEQQFCQSLEGRFNENQRATIYPAAQTRRTREMSLMTDDDRNSTRSGTPIGKEFVKKRVGRPRNVLKGKNHNNSSAFSSTRSSVEHDGGRSEKKMSKYMRKKQERIRMEQEERARSTFEIKRDIDVDFGGFGIDNWNDAEAKAELEEDDEQELLNCLLPGFEGLHSPPKGMMEALDVTETGLYGMEMYPPDHNTNEKKEIAESMPSNSETSQSLRAPSTNSNNSKKNITNAATSSSSGELAEKRKRNMLFGSIAETSFSGRPRKLTDRVTEMIQSNREKETRQKLKRESEEWCYCGGENTNSDMMIECENKDCRIEWFHFDCVGLTEDPPNEWYCPECRLLPDDQCNSRSSKY